MEWTEGNSVEDISLDWETLGAESISFRSGGGKYFLLRAR